MPEPLLEARGLCSGYGATRVVHDLDLAVHPGEVVALLGPNGAGKTTTLLTLAGELHPQDGEVLLDGVPVRSPCHRRARAGISRSFQAVELFEEMTVRDNLLVAADRQAPSRYPLDLVWPTRQAPTEVMGDVVKRLGLEGHLDRRPSELDHGAARLVGIARSMVTEPFVVFLDEPAAGLGVAEREELRNVISGIGALGIAVVLVEHDVPLVLSTCQRVVVLDFGRVIAAGTPEEIRGDPAVIAAYLGSDGDPTGEPAGDPAKPAGDPAEQEAIRA